MINILKHTQFPLQVQTMRHNDNDTIDNNNRLLSRNEMYFLYLTGRLHVLVSVTFL